MLEIKKCDFERMYRKMKVKDMAKKLGISTTTLYQIIKDMKIKKKGKKEVWKKIIVKE